MINSIDRELEKAKAKSNLAAYSAAKSNKIPPVYAACSATYSASCFTHQVTYLAARLARSTEEQYEEQLEQVRIIKEMI